MQQFYTLLRKGFLLFFILLGTQKIYAQSPTITTNPSSTTICAGNNATFIVTASGTATITFQWQVDQGSGFANVSGAVYTGGTSNILNITGASAGMNGYVYRCIATNGSGFAISGSATLTVNALPAVTSSPSNTATCVGGNASFSTTATGVGLTYQWQVNTGAGFANVPASAPYSGGTTNTLSITGATLVMNGYQYQCVVSGTCSPAATSGTATLTINTAPAITSNPANDTVCAGGNVIKSVTATGAGLTYQWQVNTGSGFVNVSPLAPYSGTTTSSLTITGVTAGMNGYQYRCVVSGTCAPSATSNNGLLVVNTSPAITTQPVSFTLCSGGTAVFGVLATGTGLTYQWQENAGTGWVNITSAPPYSGATTSTLTITGVAATYNGYLYRVIISGTCPPAVTSNQDTLTVNTAPAITTQPVSSTVCSGSNTSFSVSATGTGLTYQWQVNTGSGFVNVPASSPYSGGTTNTLTISPTSAAMNGYLYRVIVTGTCTPAVTSSTATLTVNTAPAITTQPTSVTVCAGSGTSFSVVATGTALTYQWQVNTGSGFANVPASAPYTGTTAATLNLSTTTVAMNGYQYQCIISGTCSPSVTTNIVTLTVNTAPAITTQPVSTTVCAGNTATFTVAATGTALTYQWQVNTGAGFANVPASAPYSGTTSATLTINPTTAGMTGYIYRVIISGTCSPSVTSNSDTLTVNTAPTITFNPSSTTVCAGGTAFFFTGATGTALTYQWQVNTGSGYVNLSNGGVYSGVTTNFLTVTGVTAAMNGYQYRCVVSGTCPPSATTTGATLTVNTSPVITTQPVASTICAGNNTTFSVVATGTTLTYQWYVNAGAGFVAVVNGGVYSGATTATLTITGATAAMNGYTYECLVSGACTPAVTSNTALLTVNTAPAITSQPTTVTVCAGSNTSFTVAATGAGLTYQWQVNSGAGFANITAAAPYSGGTTATLTITGVTVAMNGYTYRVIINGTCTPSVTSNTATLNVNTAPAITSNPSSTTICAGFNTSYTVGATGAGLTYQWQVNSGAGWTNLSTGGVYSGTNTATLIITGATVGMNGYQYECVVSGTCTPSATSSSATITVNAPPSITTQPADAYFCSGGTVTYTVSANGAGLTYQWQVNTGTGWINLTTSATYSGTNTATLTISGVIASMAGNMYRVIVSGTCAPPAISNAANLIMNASPAITSQPSSTTSCVNGVATFSVTATGAGLTYQWQVNNGTGWVNCSVSPYSGTKTNVLTINPASYSITGYQYRCMISGTCAPSIVTGTVTLTVSYSNQWTGNISSAWSNPGNWACGVIPNANTNVFISPGVPNQPLVDINTAICDSLTLIPGASLGFVGTTNMLEIKGSIFSTGFFDPSTGTVKFSGNGQQLIPSASTYYNNIILAASGNKELSGAVLLTGTLTLNQGLMVLGAFDYTSGDTAHIVNGSVASYILTNGLGKIYDRSVGSTQKPSDFIPVGASHTSYTPLTIKNTGTADTFAIWVYDHVYRYYINDIPTVTNLTNNAVDRTWVVEENTPGGSNVTLTLQWNAVDELTGFDRTACYVSHFMGTSWIAGSAPTNATGAGPYTMTLGGITTFSPFGVGSSNTLPVNNVTKDQDMVVLYPNPVNGALLNVRFDNPASRNIQIRVMDILGKEISTTLVNPADYNGAIVPMNVQNLSQGVYMLQLLDKETNNMQTIRFIKQ